MGLWDSIFGGNSGSSSGGPGGDVKVRLGEDSKTDTFFGGKGKADGPGHGHAVTNSKGDVEFLRDAARGNETRGPVLIDKRK